MTHRFFGDKLLIGGELAGTPLSQDLGLEYDELESCADVLIWCEEEFMRMCESKDTKSESELEREVAVVRHLLEKVTEVSAVL